jgi:hypothetical protein
MKLHVITVIKKGISDTPTLHMTETSAQARFDQIAEDYLGEDVHDLVDLHSDECVDQLNHLILPDEVTWFVDIEPADFGDTEYEFHEDYYGRADKVVGFVSKGGKPIAYYFDKDGYTNVYKSLYDLIAREENLNTNVDFITISLIEAQMNEVENFLNK